MKDKGLKGVFVWRDADAEERKRPPAAPATPPELHSLAALHASIVGVDPVSFESLVPKKGPSHEEVIGWIQLASGGKAQARLANDLDTVTRLTRLIHFLEGFL